MSVQIVDLSVWFNTGRILKDINLDFKEKRITAIVGPSGCGKTTLLKSINRTAELDERFIYSGEILLSGENIYKYKDASVIRRRVGLVFQTPVALPLSIKENVIFGPRYYGERNKKRLHEICEECLKRAALWDEVRDKLHSPAGELSGGQKQRLSIARVLAVEPEVLLLDEPCSSLDPASTRLIEELLIELSKRLTIIIVTHNISQAKRIAQESIFMTNGKVIESGPADMVFYKPKQQETLAFLEQE